VGGTGLPPDQRLSWFVPLLPFLEQDALYRRLDPGAGWDAAANGPAVQAPLRVVRCADWEGEVPAAETSHTPYLGVAGVGADAPTLPAGAPGAGAFGYDRRTALRDVTDGTSATVLVLESARENGPWAQGGPPTVRGVDPEERPYLGTGRPFGGTHFAENASPKRGQSVGCQALMLDGSVRFLREAVAPEVLEAMATVAGGEQVVFDD
jgi:hypothetical protein